MKRGIILSLLSVFICIVVAEWFLRAVDPLGAYTYFESLRIHREIWQADPLGYALPPGVHQYHGWSATIDRAGNRVMPVRPGAECQIAMIGDSVAFGLGVADHESVTHLLAQHFPQAQFINTAKPGYNARNLLLVTESQAADGYIYLPVDNDDNVSEFPKREYNRSNQSAVMTYIQWRLYKHRPGIDPHYAIQWRDMLQGRPFLVILYGDRPAMAAVLEVVHPEFVSIPAYTQNISIADPHPSPEGHKQLFESMEPYVKAFLIEVCP